MFSLNCLYSDLMCNDYNAFSTIDIINNDDYYNFLSL